MPRGKDLKRRVRARMSRTGERYTEAREKVRTVSGGAPGGVPGWHLAGDRPQAYEIGVEPIDDGEGRVAYLRSMADPGQGFGTLMQTMLAVEYRGKRVRLSAAVRGEAIEAWAGLWVRIDGPGRETLGFDNMQGRPLRGTFDWTTAEVVLDVPPAAQQIAFGVLLTGSGTVRLRDVKFEAVGTDVPVTHIPVTRTPIARRPQNLDFSEPA